MMYKGRVQNGAIVLDEPVQLPGGTEVEVVIYSRATDSDSATPRSLYDRLKPFIGMADGLLAEGSVNLDNHLYRAPKA